MDAYCMQREHKPLNQLCQELLQEQDVPIIRNFIGQADNADHPQKKKYTSAQIRVEALALTPSSLALRWIQVKPLLLTIDRKSVV